VARRVILDTGVLIAIERGRLDVDSTDASADFDQLTGVRAEVLTFTRP
jgi:hypothetical protein